MIYFSVYPRYPWLEYKPVYVRLWSNILQIKTFDVSQEISFACPITVQEQSEFYVYAWFVYAGVQKFK